MQETKRSPSMVATQTTPRLATVLATRHSPGTMTRVCRLAFAVMFTGGAAIHVAIVVTGTETYRHVADTAFIPFVKQAWLVPLLRDDFGNLWGPRRRTPVSGWAAAPARREPSGARCFPATSSSTTPPW